MMTPEDAGRSRTVLYILDEHGEPVAERDVRRWGEWFENGERRQLERTELADGALLVSTVFLGVDHAFGFARRPVLWETMVFHSPPVGPPTHPLHEHQVRYASQAEARRGHAAVVALVRETFRRRL